VTSARELLQRLRERNVELFLDGDAIRVAPKGALSEADQADLRMARDAMQAVLEGERSWRVEVMRRQVPPKGPIPALQALPGQRVPRGACASCGVPLVRAQRLRCHTCGQAARRALRDGCLSPNPPMFRLTGSVEGR
jgi:hypothetical protein